MWGRFEALFAVAVGLVMIGLWTGLVATGGVPDLATDPLEIGLHLLAELLTSISLIAAGVGRLRGRSWAERLVPVALGMLLYTVVNSAGFYAGGGEFVAVGGFVVLTVLTALLVSRRLLEGDTGGSRMGV